MITLRKDKSIDNMITRRKDSSGEKKRRESYLRDLRYRR